MGDAPPIDAGELRDRVAKGVAWLDQQVPDWPTKVEVNSLDMTALCNCVLGQVFSNETTYDQTKHPFDDTGYDVGLDLAAETDPEAAESEHEWAISHGFDSPGGRIDVFEALQDIWTGIIRVRRALR